MAAVLTQIENALPQLIASLIIAALTAGVGRIVNALRGHNTMAAQPVANAPVYPTPNSPVYPASNAPVYPASNPYPTPNPYPGAPMYPTTPGRSAPAAPRLNWGQALWHIGILQLVVNVVGVIVGVLVRLAVPQQDFLGAFIAVQLLLGTLVMIGFFVLFGLRVPRALMWRHLSVVALGTAVLTLLVNSVFALTAEFLNPAADAFALFQSFLAMGLGGGIVALLRPKAAATPAASQFYNAPTRPPYYPPNPPNPPEQRLSPAAPPNPGAWPGTAAPPAGGGAPPPAYGPGGAGYPPPAPRQP